MRALELVLAELKTMRKRPDGASVAAVAESPTICQLLGNGDPLVAWSELHRRALDVDWSIDIEAAWYSLAMASTERTHLARLEEFAAQFYIDQRQARRYSDRGVIQLARLTATNWATASVPSLDVYIRFSDCANIAVNIRCSYPDSVRMRQPQIRALDCGTNCPEEPPMDRLESDHRVHLTFTRPLQVKILNQIAIEIVWSGELWPKFGFLVVPSAHQPASVGLECLGAKARVEIHS